MSRRRLRVVSSSDEEEEEQPPPPPPQPAQQLEQDMNDFIIDDIETDFETVTLKSSNPTPVSNNSTNTANTFGHRRQLPEPVSIDISDESEENLVNTEPTNNPNFDNANRGYYEVSDSQVNGVLERLGLRLKREWLDSCLCGLQSSIPGFHGMDDAAKAKFCFEQFLCSDMNHCGAGVLPSNVQALHFVDLKGPFVLQVDEIVNISCPLRGRYQNAAAGVKRCLKLSMTDGVQRVFGMEYRPIKDLEVLAPAGLKVAVCNVNVRRGMLMLVPEVLQVLGGAVKELEAARQMLVNEVNKPPRGRRTRTGVVPPLAARATLAAWPQHSDVPQHAAQTTRMDTTSHQASEQAGTTNSIPTNNVHRQAYATVPNLPATWSTSQLEEHDEVARHTDIHLSRSLNVAGEGTLFGSSDASSREDMGVPVSRINAEHNSSPVVQPLDPVFIPGHIDEQMVEAVMPSTVAGQVHTLGVPVNHTPGEDVAISVSRDKAEQNTSSGIDMDSKEISMVDEVEHHFMLSRVNEIPFTYLASLSAKYAAIEDGTLSVRGNIKCFLTGVKGFQFKQRTAYELRVYVDDGSLISEILISDKVVQNVIGYSPQEATIALASTDAKRVSEMKETIKQFQIFLANFEGIMLVEISKASPVPVAVEMSQGCPASDAWLLLQRLKSLRSAAKQKPSHLNPIEVSP